MRVGDGPSRVLTQVVELHARERQRRDGNRNENRRAHTNQDSGARVGILVRAELAA
jgi:hypothetical protein